MENITKQLKFFSRKGRDQFETLDLRDIVSAAHDLLEPNVREIDATVVISAPDEALLLNGNRMRLEQVATNILRNALDALDGSEERRITVTLGQTSSDVWLEVADSGHGLGDRSLEELREPFATTRESGKGMGLGLTISAGIISDHGGSISASNGAETGAVFRVTLPREMKEVA
ncbi:MAG: ATP-binding protein, partial [Pseudomonadota bacterium]